MPSGILMHWDLDRGFGFFKRKPDNCFVHVRAFERAALQPVRGQRYYFDTELDREGRERATDLELVPEYAEA